MQIILLHCVIIISPVQPVMYGNYTVHYDRISHSVVCISHHLLIITIILCCLNAMLVGYLLSSMCLRLYLFPQLYFMQYN